jgi:hypothetical protein
MLLKFIAVKRLDLRLEMKQRVPVTGFEAVSDGLAMFLYRLRRMVEVEGGCKSGKDDRERG